MPDTNLLDAANELELTLNQAEKDVQKQHQLDIKAQIDELNELYDKLNKNYYKIENKISTTFEILHNSLQNRQKFLLDELKKYYDDKQKYITDRLADLNKQLSTNFIIELESTHSINKNSLLNSIENIDFYVDDQLNEIDENHHSFLKANDGNNINNNNNNNKITNCVDLNYLIKNYGKIISKEDREEDEKQSQNSSNGPNLNIDCKISGKGLVECYVNEEATFNLAFQNRDPNSSLAKSNVSFLDIFIIASEKPRISGSVGSARGVDKQSSRRCNCDCKLECISEGLYAVKYKLDKKGVYSLNILVNKKHIGDSPYNLICTERSTLKKPEVKRAPFKAHSSYSIQSNSMDLISNKANNIASPIPKNNTKTSSMSHLFNNTSLNIYSNSRPVTPNSISKNRHFSSSILSNTSTKNKSNLRNSNSANIATNGKLTSNNLNSNDDSLASSIPSILSDSISGPISPIVASKPRISSLDEFFSGKREDDFLYKIGSRGRGNSEFMNPQAVCSTSEYIYVTDSNNQKIDVFSHDGDFKFSLGAGGTQNSKVIRRPVGIEPTSDGKILVVDYELRWVNVFEENGKFVNKICQNKLLGPKGICINRFYQNQIIIADSKANSVCIFDSNGKFLQRFGNLGNKNENFAGPQYVCCMSNGDIIITDFYNHCIKIFDYNGQFKFSFGSNGSNPGQFNGPTGVCTDNDDNIIVVDWGNSRIQVFDKHGVFIKFVNSELNQLYGPQDITIINNTIAVADSGNHCLKIFEYS